jgi:hypothetical protein
VKKAPSFALAVLAVALITGCAGPEGDVYLSFDWTYTPDWYNTTDLHLPDTIYRTAEYLTAEGSYYFEYYHSVSGYLRWINYTLTAHEGMLIMIPGEDARFELFLAAFSDPDLIQWESVTGVPASGPDEVPAAAAPLRSAAGRVQTFARTETEGRWTLTVRGGVIGTSAR